MPKPAFPNPRTTESKVKDRHPAMGKTGKTSNPDIEKLRKFIQTEEKEHTLFYAGRESLIQRIVQSARNVAAGVDNGRRGKGLTWLVHGAPGAGKTALMEEIGKNPGTRGYPRKPLSPGWEERGPLVVSLDAQDLEDGEAETVKIIADRLAETTAAGKPFAEPIEREREFSLGYRSLASWRRGQKTVTAPPGATFRALKALTGHLKGRPIILTIDEIQDVTSRSASVLAKLHSGNHGMQILPVCGGLSNSKNVLENMLKTSRNDGKGGGLSRIVPERIALLGRMHRQEAEEAVKKMLDECNIRNWHRSDIPSILARNTEGWPQHLHNGMRILAQLLVKTDGDLSKVDPCELERREAIRRRESHENRKTDEMEESHVYVARVMSAATSSKMNRGELLSAMEKISEKGEERDERLPEGTGARSFLTEHLMRKGALHQQVLGGTDSPKHNDNGREASTKRIFASPIPCFATHLIEAGGPRGRIDVLNPPMLPGRIPERDEDLLDEIRKDPCGFRARIVAEMDRHWKKGEDLLCERKARTRDGSTLVHRLARLQAERHGEGEPDEAREVNGVLRELCARESAPGKRTQALTEPDGGNETALHVLCRSAQAHELSAILETLEERRKFEGLKRIPERNTPLHDVFSDPRGFEMNGKLAALLDRPGGRQELARAPNARGNSPLHLAAAHPEGGEACERLLSAGADVNATNVSGDTPLHVAAGNASGLQACEAAVKGRADVNRANKDRNTPLHVAAANPGGYWICRLLIESGADPEARNNKGMTPGEVAAEAGLPRNIPLDRDGGADGYPGGVGDR